MSCFVPSWLVFQLALERSCHAQGLPLPECPMLCTVLEDLSTALAQGKEQLWQGFSHLWEIPQSRKRRLYVFCLFSEAETHYVNR